MWLIRWLFGIPKDYDNDLNNWDNDD